MTVISCCGVGLSVLRIPVGRLFPRSSCEPGKQFSFASPAVAVQDLGVKCGKAARRVKAGVPSGCRFALRTRGLEFPFRCLPRCRRPRPCDPERGAGHCALRRWRGASAEELAHNRSGLERPWTGRVERRERDGLLDLLQSFHWLAVVPKCGAKRGGYRAEGCAGRCMRPAVEEAQP